MKENKVVNEYNYMRIIGIILVVIGHSVYLKMNAGYGGVDYTTNSVINSIMNEQDYGIICNKIINPIYFFHMPLMFFISGCVFQIEYKSSKYENLEQLGKNKFKRLVIPYLLFGILWMVPIKLIAHFYNAKTAIVENILLLYGSGNGHLWFLLTLFWIFIISYILCKYVKNKIALIFTIVCLFVFSNLISSFGLPGGVSISYYLLFFFAGMAFEVFRNKYNTIKLRYIVLISIILIAGINVVYRCVGSVDTTAMPILNCVKALGMLGCCLLVYNISHILSYCVSSGNRIYCCLNKHSFSIYLLHDPLNYIVLYIVGKYMYNGIYEPRKVFWVMWLSRTIVIYFISMIIAILLSKVKKIINVKYVCILAGIIILLSLVFLCYRSINLFGLERVIYQIN